MEKISQNSICFHVQYVFMLKTPNKFGEERDCLSVTRGLSDKLTTNRNSGTLLNSPKIVLMTEY